MRLKIMPGRFAVCRLVNAVDRHDTLGDARPFFFAVTSDEISLVCPSDVVPPEAFDVDDGWALLQVEGPLDFGLVGVIAALSQTLAAAGIPIFVTSTFLTDYVMVKADRLDDAVRALSADGNTVLG